MLFVHWSITKYIIIIFRILLACIFALKWVHFLSYHKHFWFYVSWCFPYFQNIDKKQVTKKSFLGKWPLFWVSLSWGKSYPWSKLSYDVLNEALNQKSCAKIWLGKKQSQNLIAFLGQPVYMICDATLVICLHINILFFEYCMRLHNQFAWQKTFKRPFI